MPCPICKREHPYSVAQAMGVLARTPRLLEILTSRTSPARLTRRPVPGKWCPREIVGHLNDCEWVFGVRYRKIAAEPGSTLPAFEQDSWVNRLGNAKMPLKGVLGTFAAMRSANVALLKSLPASAWKQTAEHPEYGSLRLKDLILHLATHDASHLARLEDLCPPTRARTKRS